MKTDFKHYGNITICTIADDNGLIFYGEAKCAPEDEDKYKDRIGEEIAERRAMLQSLIYIRQQLRSEIQNQKHVIGCMKQNKNFSSKHNEFRLFARDLRFNEQSLKEINNLIRAARFSLDYYTGHI